MKIFKIIYDKFTTGVNKKAGDWDDTINIPDIAEIVTDDDKEKDNPLCSEFWQYQVFNKPNIELFVPDYKLIINSYKQ